MGSGEGNVRDVTSRRAGDSNELGDFESDEKDVLSDRNHNGVKHVNREQQKGQRRKEGKVKESVSPVYDSMLSMFDDFAANGSVATVTEVPSGHGFEVGDMVWGKVKSHPWWPGFVYSEEFAKPSVRRSKREGLLLVAFFGDSSYGWFDPSELIPFDSNFAEKSRQTNSRTFVKAVEEAMDEVSRRSALGLSCICRNKQNFRKTDVQGFFAVDVVDYDPGAVYSIDAIGKARDSFQPSSALDFLRHLALEPTGSEDAGIDFIKNKATLVSYRKAVYEEFDETYAQAFGYPSDRPSSGSAQEHPSGKTPSKAPLSGRQVFADTSSKGKSPAKPNRPKDDVKKDKYLFKRRDESHQKEKPKVTSSPQPTHLEDPGSDDYMLQKRVLATHEQIPVAIMEEDKAIVLDCDNSDSQMITAKVDSPSHSSATEVDDKSSNVAQEGVPASAPGAIQRVDGGPKKVKVSKRPAGELGSGKSLLPEKKKKRKKESLTSAALHIVRKEKVSSNEPVQSVLPSKTPVEDSRRADSKAATGTQETAELGHHEAEIPRVLGDLHSLALDPFHAVNRGWPVKVRQVFLKYRSFVFQKSLNLSPLADDEENDTHSSKSQAVVSENGARPPAVKPQVRSSDDPTKGGRKRGPSDRQEEIAEKKKKKVGDIRNLTEKKVTKKIEEPAARDVKQAGGMPLWRKTGPEVIKKTEQRAAEPTPTMLMMKFPVGGSLPSINELKARFACYGPMDHSATRIYWNTFSCRVVYRHKAHAQAAYRFVVGSSSLFGNTGVKCCLKEVGESDPPPLKAPKEDHHHQAAVEDRAGMPGVQLKSCLRKSGGEEAGSRGMARVKFMLGGEENELQKGASASSFSSLSSTSLSSSSSNAKMDINSKNFHEAVPVPTSSSIKSELSRAAAPSSLHYNSALTQPRRTLSEEGGEMAVTGTLPSNVDIRQEMLSLLTKCNDVVTNVRGVLGYVPYHQL